MRMSKSFLSAGILTGADAMNTDYRYALVIFTPDPRPSVYAVAAVVVVVATAVAPTSTAATAPLACRARTDFAARSIVSCEGSTGRAASHCLISEARQARTFGLNKKPRGNPSFSIIRRSCGHELATPLCLRFL